MTTKIWLSGRGILDQATAYAELWDEAKVRERFKTDKPVGDLLGKVRHLDSIDVEWHSTDNDVVQVTWGAKQPAIDLLNLMQHNGTRVIINGTSVYNDLEMGPEEDAADHEDCEYCKRVDGAL